MGSGLVAHLHLVAGVIWSKLWLGKGLGSHVRTYRRVHMRPHPLTHEDLFFFFDRREPAAGERSVAKRTVQGTERSEV